MAINVRNYIFNQDAPSAPSINANTKPSDAASAGDQYMVDAGAYKDSMLGYFSSKASVQNRFMYDVLAEIDLATINLVDNEVLLNIKADELWAEASRNKSLSSVSDMNDIYNNAKRLIAILLDEGDNDGALLTEETEAAVVYDSKFIEVSYDSSAVNFYAVAPNATGTARTFKGHDDSSLAWSSGDRAWMVTTVGDDKFIGTIDETDPVGVGQVWSAYLGG